jgi:hypothetical protein
MVGLGMKTLLLVDDLESSIVKRSLPASYTLYVFRDPQVVGASV